MQNVVIVGRAGGTKDRTRIVCREALDTAGIRLMKLFLSIGVCVADRGIRIID